MTTRGLMAGAMCAIFCIGTLAASDTAYAASKGRKRVAAVCQPAIPGRICPPLQFSRCVPCRMKNGLPGCAWTPCGPLGR
jgi:hypothetical protein